MTSENKDRNKGQENIKKSIEKRAKKSDRKVMKANNLKGDRKVSKQTTNQNDEMRIEMGAKVGVENGHSRLMRKGGLVIKVMVSYHGLERMIQREIEMNDVMNNLERLSLYRLEGLVKKTGVVVISDRVKDRSVVLEMRPGGVAVVVTVVNDQNTANRYMMAPVITIYE